MRHAHPDATACATEGLLTYFHASYHEFDWPTYEGLVLHNRNTKSHPVGLWASNNRAVCSLFGTNIYSVDVTAAPVEIPMKELYGKPRSQLIREGLGLIQIGLHFFCVVDLDLINEFKLIRRK